MPSDATDILVIDDEPDRVPLPDDLGAVIRPPWEVEAIDLQGRQGGAG